MDLMLDPACELNTFGDTIKVGRACDEAGFYWLEDPFKDGGISQFAHRKLRQIIRTPLLMTEHVRTLEPHVDFALADATDFLRGDIGYDGITGVMKLAHAAEGLGLDIEMHGCGPAIRHVMTSLRNTNYYEMGLLNPKGPGSFSPAYTDYADGLDAIDAQGNVYAPTGPGLGVTLDWEYIKAHQVGRAVYGRVYGILSILNISTSEERYEDADDPVSARRRARGDHQRRARARAGRGAGARQRLRHLRVGHQHLSQRQPGDLGGAARP
jgi:L-alanine-DL-glutamate epimerase-like enolase superfamily enzyme